MSSEAASVAFALKLTFRQAADHDVAVGDDADELALVDDRHDAGVLVPHDLRDGLQIVVRRRRCAGSSSSCR
jgi:hypothetical protein